MREILWEYFTQTAYVARHLLKTGTDKIVFVSPRLTDRYWAADRRYNSNTIIKESDWIGANNLGEILMDIRSQLPLYMSAEALNYNITSFPSW